MATAAAAPSDAGLEHDSAAAAAAAAVAAALALKALLAGEDLGSSTEAEGEGSWREHPSEGSSEADDDCWSDAAGDLDDDAGEVCAILASRRWRGEVYCLVRREGLSEARWELEDDLLDSGCSGQEACRFRQERLAAARRAAAARAEKRLKRQGPRGAAARRRQRILDAALARYEALVKSRGAPQAAEIWPDFMLRIQQAFKQAQYRVIRVENICDPQRVGGLAGSDMVFHGTCSTRLANIVDIGLQMPGHDGVTIANGSAYGVKIYTAPIPQPSYARGFDYLEESCVQMLCCAGASGQKHLAAKGAFWLYHSRESIVPVFLVTAAPMRAGEGARPEPRYESRLVSPVPVEVADPDGAPILVLPGEGPLEEVLAQRPRFATTMNWSMAKRVPYVSKGRSMVEDAGRAGRPARFSRQRRSLTARQLRAQPRCAKRAFREGRVLAPRRDGGREEARPRTKVHESKYYSVFGHDECDQ